MSAFEQEDYPDVGFAIKLGWPNVRTRLMILVARRVRIRLGRRRRINEALQYPKPRVAQESEEEESSS